MNTWGANKGQKATPDYGTLGPGSDLQPGQQTPNGPTKSGLQALSAVAVGAVAALVLVLGSSGVARAAWQQISDYLSLHGKPEPASPAVLSEHQLQNLDSGPPQSQAELLLERSINHYDGANDQIARVSIAGEEKLNWISD